MVEVRDRCRQAAGDRAPQSNRRTYVLQEPLDAERQMMEGDYERRSRSARKGRRFGKRALPSRPPLATARNSSPSVMPAAVSHDRRACTGQATEFADDRDRHVDAFLVAFRVPDAHAQPALAELKIGRVERDELRPAERAGERDARIARLRRDKKRFSVAKARSSRKDIAALPRVKKAIYPLAAQGMG